MKPTDYAPRAGALDSYLKEVDLIGVEVGCDVGAHAEALLRYCAIKKLYLVDLWTKDYYRGYCMGRIQSQGWKNRVEFIQKNSHQAAADFSDNMFDFIYIDIAHDTETVTLSLKDWWPKLKVGGILGYRNYSKSTIRTAVDNFIEHKNLRSQFEPFHNEMIFFKDLN